MALLLGDQDRLEASQFTGNGIERAGEQDRLHELGVLQLIEARGWAHVHGVSAQLADETLKNAHMLLGLTQKRLISLAPRLVVSLSYGAPIQVYAAALMGQ